MKTSLSPFAQQAPWGKELNQILRTCVHCGFCNAVCPTYQLLGNELDGPRGRIYLIKAFLEGHPVSRATQRHLDLCLTCRSCERTCPSGVPYGHLLNQGRELLEQQIRRPLSQRLPRWGLRKILAHPHRFQILLSLGRLFRPCLPRRLRNQIPTATKTAWPVVRHARSMLVLNGCVQAGLTPYTNLATAQVLDKLGISLLPSPHGCCGALSYHLGASTEALNHSRRLIDAWWPAIEQGAEAIVTTASGCGVFIKEYAHLLRADPHYAEPAKRVSQLTKDVSEIVSQENLSPLQPISPTTIALHLPCTLQHGQQLGELLESLLKRLGFQLTVVPDAHLCCGSAGTYSLLNPDLAQPLLINKLNALQSGHPQCIVTANIGCQLHLQSHSTLPVKHWIELLVG